MSKEREIETGKYVNGQKNTYFRMVVKLYEQLKTKETKAFFAGDSRFVVSYHEEEEAELSGGTYRVDETLNRKHRVFLVYTPYVMECIHKSGKNLSQWH